MNAYLMYPSRDFDLKVPLPPHQGALIQDLDLETLFQAMSDGDELLLKVSRHAVLLGCTNDAVTILHRQAVLKDVLQNRQVVRRLYALTLQTLEERKRYWFGASRRYLAGNLYSGSELLRMLIDALGLLAGIVRWASRRFESEGFRVLFEQLDRELTDEYLSRVRGILQDLTSDSGTLISAGLGDTNEGIGYAMRKTARDPRSWLKRLIAKGPPSFTYRIPDRDESGHRALSDLRDRAVAPVTQTVAAAVEHLLHFFEMLRNELAFYVACLNLHERLREIEAPESFPTVEPQGECRPIFTNLYDVCLALRLKRPIVSNSASVAQRNVLLVTGANQGGKSTFLRSIGVAQLMLQCGLFVGADAFRASTVPALFTHYKRGEDPSMTHGKFDEELARMSEIADKLVPHAMVLFNESFAATNEREGSRIASQITQALVESHVAVFFVTHLYDFAHTWYQTCRDRTLFLRAERAGDGTRTFKLMQAQPLTTSYGPDLYKRIFESTEARSPAALDDYTAHSSSTRVSQVE
jgi:hypothetical protein